MQGQSCRTLYNGVPTETERQYRVFQMRKEKAGFAIVVFKCPLHKSLRKSLPLKTKHLLALFGKSLFPSSQIDVEGRRHPFSTMASAGAPAGPLHDRVGCPDEPRSAEVCR